MAAHPPGDSLHRAVQWISDERRARPDEKMVKLLEEAGFRFDLSPYEQQWLAATFLREDGAKDQTR